MTQETEILAWRGWRLALDDEDAPVLQSVSFDALWHGPVFVADRVPGEDGTTGVYAVKDVAGLEPYPHAIRGEVALSGRVIEGEKGYRAERGAIRSLEIIANTLSDIMLLNLAEALEQRYAVAVTYDARKLARNVGAIVKSSSSVAGIAIHGSSNVMITNNVFR